MLRLSHQIYCAFCRIPRKVYTKRHATWINVLLSVLTAGLLMLVLWQSYDSRVFILIVVCLACSEAFVQLRWRVSVSCPYCGFDPILYRRRPEKAAAVVKAFLDKKREEPATYLSAKNPLLTLPKRSHSGQKKEVQNSLPHQQQ